MRGAILRSVGRIRHGPTVCRTTYAGPQVVQLNYQTPPPPGKRTGRYIDQPGDVLIWCSDSDCCSDLGDVVDENVAHDTVMNNARELAQPPTLESMGFQLEKCATRMSNFDDTAEIVETYYAEMRELVKKVTGANRVFVFDHTVNLSLIPDETVQVRSSEATNLNALDTGAVAAAVPRVHADYTAESAPRRLQQYGEQGIYSLLKNRNLTRDEVDMLASDRFQFVNVWRGITEEPVQRMPLACCSTGSVQESDRFLYELVFPDRVGLNYSMKFSDQHQWFYYPEQTKEECLVFKTFDTKEDGPQFVFHTAFEDPRMKRDAPVRRSVEIRAIAFFAPNQEDMQVSPSKNDHV